MKTPRTWPSLKTIAFVCAVLGGVAGATLVSYNRSVSPVAPNSNVNRVDDQVGSNKSSTGATSTDSSETKVSPPISATDRPLTHEDRTTD